MRRSGDRTAAAVGVALALVLGAGVARADGAASGAPASGPARGGAASAPAGGADAPPGPAPEPGVIAPPHAASAPDSQLAPDAIPAPDPLVAPTVPPAPLTRAPLPKPHPWVGPLTIALEAGAAGFAIASVAVISSGPTTDAWRVNLAAGLGAGTLACAAVGVVIGFAVR